MSRDSVKVHNMVRIAMLGGIAIVLYMPMFQIPMFLPWLKLDFSMVPCMLATFSMGPVAGVIVVGIKSALGLFTTTSMGIGELADFLMSAAIVLPAGLIYVHGKSRKAALLGMGIGTVITVIVSVLANQFMLLPLYAGLMGYEGLIGFAQSSNPAITSMGYLFVYGVIPFNLVRGVVVSAITYVLYKPLSPLLHERKHSTTTK